MSQLPKQQVDQLQAFIELLKTKPETLHDPTLLFFRNYLASLGANIPDTPQKKETTPQFSPKKENACPNKTNPEKENVSPNKASPEQENVCPKAEEKTKETDECEMDVDSDIELDMAGVIEPDNDEPQEMGNCDSQDPVELSDEQMDKFNEKRSEAMAALSEREWEKSINLFTEAIKINSSSAAMYAKRGTCFLKTNRPNACIRDCDRAIQLNPDSAAAHKFRGRAHRLLGHFVEAAKDLRIACKIDFDEVTDEWLKEVTPNAKKIEEHERNNQRRQEEREIKEKKEKIQKAREARQKAANEAKSNGGGHSEGMSGMGGLGGMFQDPELFAALQDPEVATAFQEISTNPANLSKYQNNPKVMAVVTKMMGKFGGGGSSTGMPGMHGMGSGFPGGMPQKCPAGFSSDDKASDGCTKSAQPSTTTTDDLD